MAKWLYHLGKGAYRRKKTVFLGMLGLLILAISAGIGMGSAFSGDMSIPGTKSEKAGIVMQEAFGGGSEGGGTIRLIYKAPEGETLESESVKQLIQSTEQEVAKDSEVASIAPLYESNTISADKRIGYSTVTYKSAAGDVTDESIEHVQTAIEAANDSGLQTELGGTVALSEVSPGGISEVIGVAVAFLILILTFGSFVAAGLPILTALVGLGTGIMLIFVVSHYSSIPTFSLSLASMLGLAVGIDYGLFIISRFKQNLKAGMERQEAAAMANATAGSAVVFAGLTVIIALLGLQVTGIPFLGAMGIAGAVTVLVAVLISLVLTPALLGATKKLFVPKAKKNANAARSQEKQSSESNVWGRLVTKFPLPAVIVSVLVLGLISLPFLDMHTGLPNNGTKSIDTTERRGYDLLAEGFGPGFNGPLVIVAKADSGATDPSAAIAEATKGLIDLPNVASVTPPQLNAAGDTAILTLLPDTDPLDTKTSDLVKLIREQSDSNHAQTHAELMVTGSTAVDIDISDMLNKALPKFAGLIAGLAFVLLAIVFRSILIPVKAVLGYLLTLTATLGFVVYVVQEGHMAGFFGIAEPAPVLNFLPVLVAGILFGLAMDYEVFLVSAMREKFVHENHPRKAILYGIKSNGRVVLAAGLIMVTVFASFIFAEDTIVKSMGLALAFGILFDAFIVRLTLVPALMSLLGKSAWFFPKWLDRILPKVDIEGESFQKISSR
ncbi:MMPL family transporter [Cohnella thailandensis]|uniref:MMPL family transporter n=1 Tax=Cohnella thailandensis TaxID=557557 RepID=A0A841SVC3_9BACL|nr:MMPL family transporter [Cohnella thailandensis]MBB6634546.1 MMPL family transporter [Cohnella thailandensis]MBP1972900.1 membrane protein YdfJ [Cohnella thailandensis]